MKTESVSSERNQYQIEVKGRFGGLWSEYFGGMSMTYADGVTTLSGMIVDRAALHGVLNKLRDLDVTLLSVKLVDNGK